MVVPRAEHGCGTCVTGILSLCSAFPKEKCWRDTGRLPSLRRASPLRTWPALDFELRLFPLTSRKEREFYIFQSVRSQRAIIGGKKGAENPKKGCLRGFRHLFRRDIYNRFPFRSPVFLALHTCAFPNLRCLTATTLAFRRPFRTLVVPRPGSPDISSVARIGSERGSTGPPFRVSIPRLPANLFPGEDDDGNDSQRS